MKHIRIKKDYIAIFRRKLLLSDLKEYALNAMGWIVVISIIATITYQTLIMK